MYHAKRFQKKRNGCGRCGIRYASAEVESGIDQGMLNQPLSPKAILLIPRR
jgi:hypothetical protein